MASSLETNKLLAAILTAGIVASGSGVLSRIIYSPQQLEEPVYVVALPEPTDAPPAEEPGVEPIAVRLAVASVEEGQAAARPCVACHSFERDGPHQVGPHLWDTVGRDIGGEPGFNYSNALLELEGIWDYEALDGFLADPRGFAPGTRMAFAGVRNPDDRADIILYLHSLSDDPQPLPEPEAVAAEEPAEAGAAEGEEPAPADGEDAAAPEQQQGAADAEQQTAAVEAEPEAAPGQAAGDEAGIGPLLAQADPSAGERAARKCVTCHSFDQGGPNKIGPHLWDVVGRDIAAVEDFAYSPALGGMEGVWDYEALDHFIENPRDFAPGTKMAFAGVRQPQERAEIIAYMRTRAENPPPLPGG